MSLTVLAAFLGLLTIESYHTHQAAAPENTHCTICKAAHQAPAMINPPVHLEPLSVSVRTPSLVVPHPYLDFVFEAHGLAPPLYS